MSAVEQRIIKFITDNQLISEGDKLLVALSGGADSVFALNFFVKFRQKYDIEICAFHLNHSLRGSESDSDESFCISLCKKLNIEIYSEKTDVSEFATNEKLSLEEAGRKIRYKKLEEYLEISNSNKIVTAHNLDDNTETVLLNLFRGTGIRGLSGIPIKRGNIIRPFLTVSKSEIINYLNKAKMNFVQDSSNEKNEYKRNYLRNEIIPRIRENINEGIDKNILNFSQIVNNSEEFTKNLIKDLFYKFITIKESEIFISKEILSIDPYLVGEVIKRVIEEQFSADINYKNIFDIKKLLNSQTGTNLELSQSLEAISEREYILIRERIYFTDKSVFDLYFNSEVNVGEFTIGCSTSEIDAVSITNNNEIEYICSEKLKEPLLLRRWESADKFKPLGLNGTKKISDFLTELKIPNSERKSKLVLLNENQIIWLVGHRIDESVKIEEKTKKVIKLWIK